MALGLPVVVTPVAMLSEIVDHGRTGFHATTQNEWVNYLKELVEQPRLCQEMGENAYKSISKQRFWTDQRADDLNAVFRFVSSDNISIHQDKIGLN